MTFGSDAGTHSGTAPDGTEGAGRIRTAFVQMLMARAVAMLSMIVSFAVLGRLLDPAAFGHFALAFAVFTVFQSLSNFGMRQYLIRQETAPSADAVATATGLQALIALLCTAICVGLGLTGGAGLMPPPAAGALAILGAALPVVPVVTATEVALHRDIAFARPALGAAGLALADAAMAIMLAALGYGAGAIAAGFVAGQFVQSAILIGIGRGRSFVRPRLVRAEIPVLLRFGIRLAAINNLPQLATLASLAALSTFAGAAAIGLYNRAKVIRDLLERTLLEGIQPAVLPALSASLRSGIPPGRLLAAKYDMLATICWPAFAVIAILAEPLTLVLLGRDWAEAVPAVRLLALGGVALPFTAMSLKLFTALDLLPAYLRIQAVNQGVQTVLCVLGALWSLEGFCLAVSVAMIQKAMHVRKALHRRGIVGGPETRRVLVRAAAIALFCGIGPALALLWDGPMVVILILGLGAAVLAWGGIVAAIDHPLFGHLRALLQTVRPARHSHA